MIAFPAGMQVMVATQPIDFRKGADGLMALVRESKIRVAGRFSSFAPKELTE
jgi:hypothetical protein